MHEMIADRLQAWNNRVLMAPTSNRKEQKGKKLMPRLEKLGFRNKEEINLLRERAT